MRRRLLTLAIVATVLALSATAVAAGRAATDTSATTLPSTGPARQVPSHAADSPVMPPLSDSHRAGRRALTKADSGADTPGVDSLEPDLVLLGTWTVRYAVGPENGFGA